MQCPHPKQQPTTSRSHDLRGVSTPERCSTIERSSSDAEAAAHPSAAAPLRALTLAHRSTSNHSNCESAMVRGGPDRRPG
jgi:hypothetical protein